MVRKINLAKAKTLVDELGLVEEYMRELQAEVDVRKQALHSYLGTKLETEEFVSSVFEREFRSLDKAKLLKLITEAQLAKCYTRPKVSTIVTIRRRDTFKNEQRRQFLKSAKRKVSK